MAKRRKSKSEDKPGSPGDKSVESSRALEADQQGEKIENWADQPDSDAYEAAAKLYTKIQKCYDNQESRNDKIDEFWNIYNAVIDENQQYTGNSMAYVPEVRNCINARVKRTLKQLFPSNRKHVDAIGTDSTTPFAVLSLLEHYIRSTKLKQTVKADLIAGDVTGQWNLYIDWTKTYRSIKKVVRQPKIVEVLPDAGADAMGVPMPEDVDDGQEELIDDEIITEGPDIVAFADEDLAVYPSTCDDLEKAAATSIRLRMSKESIQQMLDEGVFVGYDDAEDLVERVAKSDKSKEKQTPPKERTNDAGIKTEGTYKYGLIYEVHCNLPLDGGKKKQAAYVYFAGQNEILGIIRNPCWSGKRPIISAPIEKITGSFKGISKAEPVKYLQWNLNDFFNMGQDSAQYGLLPVIMTDPLSNPNWQAMVMGMAAIWPVDPSKTQALQFPELWKDSAAMTQMLQGLIRESMDVNDSMMGRAPAGRKNASQMAAMQQDQQTSITDHAEQYEETILNPLIERIFELDQQFRTESLTIVSKGEIGVRAKMMAIEPQQFNERYTFWWAGTTFITGMQRMQQQIAWMNVLRGIPPQQLNGRKLDITPILMSGTEQIFGPEVAPNILIDTRDLMTIDPEQENILLHNGFAVQPHTADDDPKHIQAHQDLAMKTGDMSGLIRSHIAAHGSQMQAKRQQQMAQEMQAKGAGPGQPGAPGGAGPGMAGTPRPGAQPGQPRPQGPPGAVHADQIQDPAAMPRG